VTVGKKKFIFNNIIILVIIEFEFTPSSKKELSWLSIPRLHREFCGGAMWPGSLLTLVPNEGLALAFPSIKLIIIGHYV
jgi:hypothetical protein